MAVINEDHNILNLTIIAHLGSLIAIIIYHYSLCQSNAEQLAEMLVSPSHTVNLLGWTEKCRARMEPVSFLDCLGRQSSHAVQAYATWRRDEKG